MDSLVRAAKQHKFREPLEGESEDDFRAALARHVRPIDMIEASEIATSRGWDQQRPEEVLRHSLGEEKFDALKQSLTKLKE
jgi:hypothetical protein